METKPTQTFNTNQPLVQPLEPVEMGEVASNGLARKYLVMIGIVVILLGTASGWLLNKNPVVSNGGDGDSLSDTNVVKNRDGQVTEEGIKDEKIFTDKTEGELQKNDGKLTEEGTHILVRPGGVSQTVYLTSSSVDLDKFIGKQVEIWGQTNTAQKAGWLIEVGYIKVK